MPLRTFVADTFAAQALIPLYTNGAFVPIVSTPTLTFAGLSQAAALVSTLDILIWDGTSQPAALSSVPHPLTFDGLSQHAALTAIVDSLIWDGMSQHAAFVSQVR